MANIIGGEDVPGKNNLIIGTDENDFIFGDPFTTGAPDLSGFDLFPFPEDFPEVGGALSSGRGGNDRILSGDGADWTYGDAYEISGNGRGGNDFMDNGQGHDIGMALSDLSGFDLAYGDAEIITDNGRGGNDIINGGAGGHLMFGDAEDMNQNSRGGNDVLNGGEGIDAVVGDATRMVGYARGGNDVVFGGDGDDGGEGDSPFSAFFGAVVGDAGWGLSDNARGGNDRLFGGAGNDRVAGDADWWIIDQASGGNDVLFGGSDNDIMYGDATLLAGHATCGNDSVYGGAGNDILMGDGNAADGSAVCGNDVLVGGAGNDWLFGDVDFNDDFFNVGVEDVAIELVFGDPATPLDPSNVTRGADRFVFANGCGQDTVFDFEIGHDKMVFKGVDSADLVYTLSDLDGNDTDDVSITFEGQVDDQIDLLNVGWDIDGLMGDTLFV